VRKILVAVGFALVLVATPTPASASTSIKSVAAYQATDSTSLSIVYQKGGDLHFAWYENDGSTTRRINLDDAGLDAYNGEFHSSRLTWATLSFSTQTCLYSYPFDPGADPEDGCTTGDLEASLRWDAYGSRIRERQPDGTIVYRFYATLSGTVTFDGTPLFDSSAPDSASIYRTVYP
jgi:hypothetical protein